VTKLAGHGVGKEKPLLRGSSDPGIHIGLGFVIWKTSPSQTPGFQTQPNHTRPPPPHRFTRIPWTQLRDLEVIGRFSESSDSPPAPNPLNMRTGLVRVAGPGAKGSPTPFSYRKSTPSCDIYILLPVLWIVKSMDNVMVFSLLFFSFLESNKEHPPGGKVWTPMGSYRLWSR